MSLPAKQNQYVEYAEKDSKGRNIAKAIDEAGGGTKVIANPTLAGTESALSGLQVGDTKYKVEAGGNLYENIFRFKVLNFGEIYFEVLCNELLDTRDKLKNFLITNGHTGSSGGSSNPYYMCGKVAFFSASSNKLNIIHCVAIYVEEPNTLMIDVIPEIVSFTIDDNNIVVTKTTKTISHYDASYCYHVQSRLIAQ